MDGRRFDDWSRHLGTRATRRTMAKATVGGALASALALFGAGAADAADNATCRGTGEVCRRRNQCCSNRCRSGRCDCRDRGAACFVDRACCSGRCRLGRCT